MGIKFVKEGNACERCKKLDTEVGKMSDYKRYGEHLLLCEDCIEETDKEKTIIKKMKTKDHSSKKKLTLSIVICLTCIIFVIFGLMIYFTYVGFFDVKYPNVIPLQKEYLVLYSQAPISKILKPNETFTAKGGFTGSYDVSGKLTLTTSALSVQNPIDVQIELFPTRIDPDDDVWKSLPENHFAYFKGAIWANDNSREGDIANPVIINLTKFNEPPLISGHGKIIYQKEDSYQFFILDPLEMSRISDQFKRDISLIYKVPNELKFYNVTKNNDQDNSIVIQSTDSLNEINSYRISLIGIFISIIIAMPSGLLYFYKKTSNHH